MKESENLVFRFSVEKNAMDGIFRGPLNLGIPANSFISREVSVCCAIAAFRPVTDAG